MNQQTYKIENPCQTNTTLFRRQTHFTHQIGSPKEAARRVMQPEGGPRLLAGRQKRPCAYEDDNVLRLLQVKS